MTASRASRRRLAVFPAAVALAAAGLILADAAPLAAQEPPPTVSKPTLLAPPQRLRPVQRQPEAAPAAPGASPGTAPEEAPRPTVEGIQIDSLKVVGPDAAGTLSPAEGGFGVEMWRGTPRPLIERLLKTLPVKTTSPTGRSMMRRLLLSRAVVPNEGAVPGSLLFLRLQQLAAMGDPLAVFELIQAAPGRTEDAATAKLDADARFLLNDMVGACSVVGSRLDSDETYWHQAYVFCQVLAGATDKAALGMSLLREDGGVPPVFFALMDRLMAGDGRTIDGLSDPNPLLLAMARAAKVTLPAGLAASDDPMVLRAYAANPEQPLDLRLAAGERAQAMGALPDKLLRDVYAAVDFTEDQMNNPLTTAESLGGGMARALLYRAAIALDVPVAQAEGTALALEKARDEGRYSATARTFLPVAAGIAASPDLAWFAPEAVRVLLVNNDHATAGDWYRVLQARARFDDEANEALVLVAPVAALAGLGDAEGWSTESLTDWWRLVEGTAGAHQRATLLYSLFEGLDEAVPVTVWDQLLGGGGAAVSTMPDPAVLRRLADASKGGRVGETVLLALLALGEAGPAESDPSALRQVVSALYRVRLVPEARLLALEAALAAGL